MFYDVEAALDLQDLRTVCKAQAECFPLMVARAACMRLTQVLQSVQKNNDERQPRKDAPQGAIWQVHIGELSVCLSS